MPPWFVCSFASQPFAAHDHTQPNGPRVRHEAAELRCGPLGWVWSWAAKLGSELQTNKEGIRHSLCESSGLPCTVRWYGQQPVR